MRHMAFWLVAALVSAAWGAPTFSALKPGERVMFYGDSITHGGGYIAYLQLFENLRHPGSGVRFMNVGRSGGSAWDGIKNLDRELAVNHPDRAVVMFGMNDIGRSNWMSAEPDDKERAARERALANYRKNMTNLVTRLTDAGVPTVLMTPTPFDQYGSFDYENIPCCNEPGVAACASFVRELVAARKLGMVELHAPLTKILRDGAKGYVFCRDRVHPAEEGHLIIAALILDALATSPDVGSVSVDVAKGADSAAFDYAPKALPFPRLPEYDQALAFYPLTERLNREIIRVRGLRPGRYELAFDGKPVGVFSDMDFEAGVNVALLPTPNQLRARSLEPVLRKFKTVNAEYRNVVLVRHMIEDAKVDATDFAAADVWLDKWLEGQKTSPWYNGVKAWADGYRAGRDREPATVAEIDGLYAEMAKVRPVASRVSVRPLPPETVRKPVRGPARLSDVAALPVLDAGAHVGYVGSIDPSGYNADWSWGEVQDENGEWILFEQEGAGCIFNFTQHRAVNPSVEVPLFRFYFDGEATPRLTARPEDFGHVAALPAPLAGAQETVRDGQVRFRIVRSFVPMAYTKGCRITSSIPLRYKGQPTADGTFGPTEGGWGHVTYQRYPDATGLETFDPAAPCAAFSSDAGLLAARPTAPASGELAPGATWVVYAASARSALVETALDVRDFTRADVTNLWLTYSFDGRKTVEAPIGAFFGCETPSGNPVRLATALLTHDTTDAKMAHFSNRFPMPFFASARVTLENRGPTVRFVRVAVRDNPTLEYDPTVTGIFTATPYLSATRNVARRNTTIGTLRGRGCLAYGTITGLGYPYPLPKGLEWGVCEGDVRCFIDDMTVPRVQSDGSESWGSWGMGFDQPPQCSPYAAYDTPNGHHEWSQVRLLVGDTYNFRRYLRFDLEHGGQNDHPESFTSGQLFGYVLQTGAGEDPVGDSAVVRAWEGGGRAAAIDWFSDHQFGRTPITRPADEEIGADYVAFKEYGLRIDIECRLPKGADAAHPVPVMMLFDFWCDTKPPYAKQNYEGVPIDDILARGYAFVRWNGNDICPNASRWFDLSRWPRGVIACLATGDAAATNVVRSANGWGTIGAWAWGNSRVMDWIASRPELDATRVAVVGHSRGGKTALWTAAQDTRFAMAVSNGSGCGGARLGRAPDPKAETIRDILKYFPNWFCPAFAEWIDRDAEVTHDADDLIRLIAPRLVYVASGSEDSWAGPLAEKAAWDAAHDIYRAYGVEDRMGYHCHEGEHKLRADGWLRFMDLADRHFKGK